MWIIYQGYQLGSSPLLAAVIHHHYFKKTNFGPEIDLPAFFGNRFNEDTIFQSMKGLIDGIPSLQLAMFGTDDGGNSVLVVGHKQCFRVLERTFKTSLQLLNDKRSLIWIDTTAGTNMLLELGVLLARGCVPLFRYPCYFIIRQGIRLSGQKIFKIVNDTIKLNQSPATGDHYDLG